MQFARKIVLLSDLLSRFVPDLAGTVQLWMQSFAQTAARLSSNLSSWLPDLWGGLLQGMPASFYGTNGPSHEEWAVYLALTLYALHQQSNDTVCVSQLGCTLGRAVRRLAEQTVARGQDWTESSILRRFNALATAEEITEISHHLRGMIQLLRAAKPDSIPLDYPQWGRV